MSEYLHISHGTIGFIAFLAAVIAFSTRKGSTLHRWGGFIFTGGMVYSILTTFYFMTENFLALAILMAVATAYFLLNAFGSLYRKPKVIMFAMILPIILGSFTAIRFVSDLHLADATLVGKGLFTFTFVFFFIRDLGFVRNPDRKPSYYIGRHAFAMIMAFSFAVMAAVRIGVNLDFIPFAYSTILPLVAALVSGILVEKKINRRKLGFVK